MTNITDERLAEIDELVSKLNHLVSLDRPENGGPYQGLAARECLSAMQQAADAIQSLRAQGGVRVEKAARNASMYLRTGFIECDRCGHEVQTANTDAQYELDAALSSIEASPAPVSEEMVERVDEQVAHVRLGIACRTPDVKAATIELLNRVTDLTAALAAKGGQ